MVEIAYVGHNTKHVPESLPVVKIQRPVSTQLVCKGDNGEEWAPSRSDLAAFGLIDYDRAWASFSIWFKEATGQYLDETELEPLQGALESFLHPRSLAPAEQQTVTSHRVSEIVKALWRWADTE